MANKAKKAKAKVNIPKPVIEEVAEENKATEPKCKLIRDGAALLLAIKNALSVGREWQDEIQRLLASAALHAVEHGNVTPLNDLFEGTKRLCHENTVARWILEYAPVTFDAKADRGKRFKYSAIKANKAKADVHAHIAFLETATPYYSMVTPKAPFQGFDLNAKIAALLKEADAYAEGIYAKGEMKGEIMTDGDKTKVKNNTAATRKALHNLISSGSSPS